MYKRQPLYFAAAAFTLVGSVMGLFSTSFGLLMAARLVQAAGSGIFIPLMMNTVLVIAPKRNLGTFLDVYKRQLQVHLKPCERKLAPGTRPRPPVTCRSPFRM